ncbi:MAG: PQQ-dependent sugar dehydrogenase [Proteobacteria bacterium]|nr:PQQ-dependent sugar dehydrogenase [Pseudomonadota bacterium]
MLTKILFTFSFISLFFCTSVSASSVFTGISEGMPYSVENVAHLSGIPWGMISLNPEEILVSLRKGRIVALNSKTGKFNQLSGVANVRHRGQGGLMDIAIPSNYASGDWIYFTYSKNIRGKGVTTLARAKRAQNRLTDWEDMLVTESSTETDRHYGSRITFDNRGHLFFSVGDRGVRPNGQNLKTHAGSVLRLNMDGSTPVGNPFVNNTRALPEIWSYGHRNPQGLFYDLDNDRLWSIEHGPRGGDEVNLILPGRNYGWPVVSHGKEYWGPIAVGEGTEKEGIEPAVKVYVPSIAPGSLMVYSGRAFPAWKGDLFSGALKLTHLNRVVINKKGKAIKEERLLQTMYQRIRALQEDQQGWIYFSTDDGGIYRIVPTH